MRRKPYFIICFLFLKMYALEADSFEQNLYLQRLTSAQPPVVINNVIIFSYEAPRGTRLVAARFSHENYSVLHPFKRNEHGIFVLALPLPPTPLLIKYRLMVDGVWTYDPVNPWQEIDSRGIVFSLFDCPGQESQTWPSPVLLKDGWVEFTYAYQPGSRVTLSGDFNAYDPFSLPLAEIKPGIYQIRIKLFPGQHYYYFVVDGIPLPDPVNPTIAETGRGQRLSVVSVPE